jgi:hypothetical protein
MSQTSSLRESLVSLKALSQRLNKASDNAADTVRLIETYLNDDCSIGIPAHVCVLKYGEDDSAAGRYLEYRRVGQKFRIAVVEADRDGEDRDVKAWSDCSREIKMQAYTKLPCLLARITAAVKNQVELTENATSEVIDQLQGLLISEDVPPPPTLDENIPFGTENIPF